MGIWLGDYPSLKSSGPTAWHLNPNTLEGDLAWGLPKSQIEWSNGLAFESKRVGGGGDLTWGLPKSQIEWSNGLAFESKHVGGIWLRDYPSLKSSGSTVWHLNPDTLGGIWLGDYPSLKSHGPTAWHLNSNTLGRLI